MAINSLAELKARVPKDEIDFKGRPFLTEERLANDPEINEYFNRTRMNWRKIPHANSYALHDSITVR